MRQYISFWILIHFISEGEFDGPGNGIASSYAAFKGAKYESSSLERAIKKLLELLQELMLWDLF